LFRYDKKKVATFLRWELFACDFILNDR